MPTCPGCGLKLPHEKLTVHERHCDGIWNSSFRKGRTIERLERRIVALEKQVGGRLTDQTAEDSLSSRIERSMESERIERTR